MPFYTRHPLDTLLLSDPFFTSFLTPGQHNTPRGSGDSSAREPSSISAVRAFSPNFDVHETPKEYVLEGELPGLDDKKKNLSIEFTDTNTLVVRGKIERSFQSGTPPSDKALEGSKTKSLTEGGEKEEKGKKAEKAGGADEHKEDDGVKYWVSERTVGSFQRSFSFPGEIDQEAVKASLEHGILKIVVPKKEKRGTRKIDIV